MNFRRRQILTEHDQIDILLEEYRSLNSLLLFRLEAMDRRLPVSVSFIAVTVASLLALPVDSRSLVLFVTPPALFWLVRTTAQHARAKEDHLRRIDEIERAINLIAGEELMVFQSRHPNRGTTTAGRSGGVTVLAVSFGSLGILVLCLFLFLRDPNPVPAWLYVPYAIAFMIDTVFVPIALRKYRYRRHVAMWVPD